MSDFEKSARKYKVKSAQEKANRDVVAPPNVSLRDKFCYHAIDALARLQVLILERLVQEPVWRSGTGKVERIRDLHDSHLENIVGMINRDGYTLDEHLRKAVLAERARRWAERGIHLDDIHRLRRKMR